MPDFIDVRRAYFHAPARRLVYVKLPPEEEEPGMCGKLVKALYGTRDAAQNWEHAYIEFLETVGFRAGIASPCVFFHEDRGIRLVVHGEISPYLDWEPSWTGSETRSRTGSRSSSVVDSARRRATTSPFGS